LEWHAVKAHPPSKSLLQLGVDALKSWALDAIRGQPFEQIRIKK
jgi:hypothetical protein